MENSRILLKWSFQGMNDITTNVQVLFHRVLLKPHDPYHSGIAPVKQYGSARSLLGREDTAGFHQASLDADSVYSQAIQPVSPASKRCWSLTKSLIGSTSSGRPMFPPTHQLAEYFFPPHDTASIPILNDYH